MFNSTSKKLVQQPIWSFLIDPGRSFFATPSAVTFDTWSVGQLRGKLKGLNFINLYKTFIRDEVRRANDTYLFCRNRPSLAWVMRAFLKVLILPKASNFQLTPLSVKLIFYTSVLGHFSILGLPKLFHTYCLWDTVPLFEAHITDWISLLSIIWLNHVKVD